MNRLRYSNTHPSEPFEFSKYVKIEVILLPAQLKILGKGYMTVQFIIMHTKILHIYLELHNRVLYGYEMVYR